MPSLTLEQMNKFKKDYDSGAYPDSDMARSIREKIHEQERQHEVNWYYQPGYREQFGDTPDMQSRYAPQPPAQIDENRSDVLTGLKRGIQQTQATGYGMGALAGSAMKKVGFDAAGDTVKKWGLEGYRRNMEEAAKYPAKYTFKDVYTGEAGVGGTVDWAQGLLGELIPSMAEAAIGTVVGSMMAPGPGSAVGAFGARTVLKKSIDKLTKEAVKKGIKGTTEAQLKKEITKQVLKNAGAKLGMGAAVFPLETGGMYAGLLEEHGVDAPATALLFGTLSTSMEYFGGNSRLIDDFIRATAIGGGGAIKKTARELIKNIPEEAAQEGGQELMSVLNTVVNTDEKLLTAKNLEQIVESAAAGAIGGGAGAVVSGGLSKLKPRQEKAKSPVSEEERVLLDEDEIGLSPEEILMGEREYNDPVASQPSVPNNQPSGMNPENDMYDEEKANQLRTPPLPPLVDQPGNQGLTPPVPPDRAPGGPVDAQYTDQDVIDPAAPNRRSNIVSRDGADELFAALQELQAIDTKKMTNNEKEALQQRIGNISRTLERMGVVTNTDKATDKTVIDLKSNLRELQDMAQSETDPGELSDIYSRIKNISDSLERLGFPQNKQEELKPTETTKPSEVQTTPYNPNWQAGVPDMLTLKDQGTPPLAPPSQSIPAANKEDIVVPQSPEEDQNRSTEETYEPAAPDTRQTDIDVLNGQRQDKEIIATKQQIRDLESLDQSKMTRNEKDRIQRQLLTAKQQLKQYGFDTQPQENPPSASDTSAPQAAPVTGKLTYKEFKKKYEEFFNEANKYTPDQAGANIYMQKMADLSDQYPGWADKADKEALQEHSAGTKSAPSRQEAGNKLVEVKDLKGYSYLNNLNPSDKAVYKIDDNFFKEASTPHNLDENSNANVVSFEHEQGGHTIESAIHKIQLYEDAIGANIGALHGSGKARRSSMASKKALADNFRRLGKYKAGVELWKQQFPGGWEKYLERQKALKDVIKGDMVIAPYPTPENPKGSEWIVTRKNKKTWSLVKPDSPSNKIRVQPAALRPVDVGTKQKSGEDSVHPDTQVKHKKVYTIQNSPIKLSKEDGYILEIKHKDTQFHIIVEHNKKGWGKGDTKSILDANGEPVARVNKKGQRVGWNSKGLSSQKDMLESAQKYLESTRPVQEGKSKDGGTGKQPAKKGIQGKNDTAYLSDNTPIKFQYEVLESKDVIPSHLADGSPNPEFDKTLQPRDRSKKTYQLQTDNIAAKLNPEAHLGENPSIAHGAPMISPDTNNVEAGHGRTQAILKAYNSQDSNRGSEYKDWLLKNAGKFGIADFKIKDMEHPILVRRRITKVDNIKDITEKSNDPETAKMSATEQGVIDADNLTGDDLSIFRPDTDGNINAASNQPFISRFLEKMTPGERVGYLNAEGKANKQLVDRIQAAIFQKAYGSDELLSLAAEEADPDMKNILNGLTAAAGSFAKARGLMADLNGSTIVDDLVDGINFIRKARADYPDVKSGNGNSKLTNQVKQAMGQKDIFGNTESSNSRDIATTISKNIRSGKRIGEFVDQIAVRLKTDIADLSQMEMFGTKEVITAASLISNSKKALENKYESKQQDIFGGTEEKKTGKGPSHFGRGFQVGKSGRHSRGATAEKTPKNQEVKERGTTFTEKPKKGQQLDMFSAAGRVTIPEAKTGNQKAGGRVKNNLSDRLSQKTRVDVETTGNIQHRGLVVESDSDAAALLAHLTKSPQEKLYTVSVDENGLIIEVHSYSKGTRHSSSADIGEMAGRVFAHGNVSKVYMVHNHPSGDIKSSPEDRAVLSSLKRSLSLKKIDVSGVIVGKKSNSDIGSWASFSVDSNVSSGNINPIPKNIKKTSIPVKERVFVSHETGDTQILNLPDLKKALKNKPSGFLLVNPQNKEVGYLEFPAGARRRDIATMLLSAMDKTNATSVFVYDKSERSSRTSFIKDLINSNIGVQFHAFIDGDVNEPYSTQTLPKNIHENSDQSLRRVDSATRQYQVVHHGGPTEWPSEPGFPYGRPRLDKIGTGEGNQAKGWGWYSASNEEVGRKYQNNVKDMASIRKINIELAKLGKIMSEDSRGEYGKFKTDIGRNAAKRYDKLINKREDVVSSPGHLYKLDIPDKVVPQLLDWDAPLSEQSYYVKKAIKPLIEHWHNKGASDSAINSWRGEQIYDKAFDVAQKNGFKSKDRQVAASEYLASIGIPGNKYLDGMSRAKGEGSYNYVIWDQKVLDQVALLERNGEKLREMQLQAQNRATNKPPQSPIAPQKVKSYFNSLGLKTGATPEGHIWVKTPGGLGFTVETVNRFSDKEYEIAINSGAMDKGGHIAGNLVGHHIKLSTEFGNLETAQHELIHILENSGILTKTDLKALDNGLLKRTGIKKGDKILIVKDKRENRANYLARVLTNREAYRGTALGRVLQKIADFVDALRNIAKATWTGEKQTSARQIARGMENGDIYGRKPAAHELEAQGWTQRSVVDDSNLVKRLESGKKLKFYRAMQLIDGKLYPPMSAKVNGELRKPTELGVWEVAEEDPSLADNKGMFKLDKANKSSIKARYNPYFHSSPSPLNDQFSSAYARPNLVTVEVEVPASEMDSAYRAKKAKDNVGLKNWHAGPVSSKLSAGKKRTVMLSRYAKAVRIVPDSEVAKTIADLIKGENVSIPDNVVTPSLKAELEKIGVPITRSKQVSKAIENGTWSPEGTRSQFQTTNILPFDQKAKDNTLFYSSDFTFNKNQSDQLKDQIDMIVKHDPDLENGDAMENIIEIASTVVNEDTIMLSAKRFLELLNRDKNSAIKKYAEIKNVTGFKLGVDDIKRTVDTLSKMATKTTDPILLQERYDAIYRMVSDMSLEFAQQQIKKLLDNAGLNGKYDTELLNEIISEAFSEYDIIDNVFNGGPAAELNDILDTLKSAGVNTDIKKEKQTNVVSLFNKIINIDGNKGPRNPQDPRIQYSTTTADPFNVDSDATLTDNFKYHIIDELNPAEKIYKAINKTIPESSDFLLKERLRSSVAKDRIQQAGEKYIKPMDKLIGENGLTVADVDEAAYARHAPEANARLRLTNARYFLNLLADAQKGSALKNKLKALDAKFKLEEFPTKEIQEGYFNTLESELKNAETDKELAVADRWEEFKAKPSGMTDKRASDLSEKWAGNKPMAKILKLFDAMNDESLKISYDAGRMTKEEYQAVRGTFDYYAPLHREGFENKKMSGTGRGLTNLGKDVMARGGSTKPAVNILANAIISHERIIDSAEKAEVAKAFINFVKENPNDNFWGIKKANTRAEYDSEGNIRRKVDNTINDNEVKIKVDGVPYIVYVDDNNDHAMRLIETIKGNSDNVGPIVNALSKFNRVLATVNTSLNPEFVFSNLIRDSQTAFFNLSDTKVASMKKQIFKDMPKAIVALRSALRGDNSHEWADIVRKYKASGAQTGWMSYDKNIGTKVKKMEGQIDLFREGNKTKKTITSIMKFVEDYNSIAENAVRLAAFKAGIDAGMTASKAAMMAKNLTVNFNQKGRSGQIVNSLYLFANAGIQGSTRLITAMVRSPKVRKMVAGSVLAAVGMAFANRGIGGDDDDGTPYYNQIDHYIKSKNMIFMIPGGKGKHIKIPLPWGYNIFWAFGTELGDMLASDHYDPLEGAARMATTVADAFNPLQSATFLQMLSPTIGDPFVQEGENTTFFGSPLMPEQNKFAKFKKPDSERYWDSVRPSSKAFAKWVNSATWGNTVTPGMVDISPETIDLAIDTLSGGAGRFFVDSLSLPFNVASGNGNLRKTPIARRFIGTKSEYMTSGDYAKNTEHIYRLKEEYKVYPEKRREIMKDKTYRLYGRMKATEKRIRNLNRIKRLSKNNERKKLVSDKIKKLKKLFNEEFLRRER